MYKDSKMLIVQHSDINYITFCQQIGMHFHSKKQPLKFANSAINIDLQINLLNTWTKYNVSDYYQDIFLAYLDEFPQEIEEKIKTEIKMTIQRQTPFFQLERITQERRTLLNNLTQKIENADHRLQQRQLSQICNLIQQLRSANLQAAEVILKMQSLYNCKSNESNYKQMEYYECMLEDLDKDNAFLKASIISNYLTFDQGYDPFFMHYYEQFHREKPEAASQSIKKLFSMNISLAYKLMKTKNHILEVRSCFKLKKFSNGEQNYQNFPNKYKMSQSIVSKKYSLRSSSLQLKSQYDEAESNQSTNRINMREYAPYKLEPINIYPSKVDRLATIYHPRNQRTQYRPQSSSRTEINLKSKLKFSKVADNHPEYKPFNEKMPIKNNRIYCQPQEQDRSSSKQFYRRDRLKNSMNYRQKSVDEPQKYKSEVGQIYKPLRLTPLKRDRTSENKLNNYPSYNEISQNRQQKEVQPKEIKVKESPKISFNQQDYHNSFYNIKNYNPITGDQFSRVKEEEKSKRKYDFNPQSTANANETIKTNDRVKEPIQIEEKDLDYQQPISKFSLKSRYVPVKKSIMQKPIQQKLVVEPPMKQQEVTVVPKQIEKNNKQLIPKSSIKLKKVDQQCQTIEMRKELKGKAQQKSKKTHPAYIDSGQSEKQEQVPRKQNIQKKLEKNKQYDENDQTLEEEDIIDQRIDKKRPKQMQSLIRTVSKPESNKGEPIDQSRNNSSGPTIKASNNETKRQIKMKVGKLTYLQFIQMLEKSKIPTTYQQIFQLEKLKIWAKNNQTYLTQFYINDNLSVVALCSPIPNVGIALKLWAPVNEIVDSTLSANLFKRYVEFVQKSTTANKIMFSGKGQLFKELESSQFVIKKQNLYERIRKIPAKVVEKEFEQFLYVQCSNVKFVQNSEEKMLFSQEIQQFSNNNSYLISYIREIDTASIPESLKDLVKVDLNISDFKIVNKMLTESRFDNYEVSQANISNISLLRMFFKSPLKSTFIVNQGYIKFNGTSLYSQGKQLVVSVGIAKNNGVLHFAKNIALNVFQEKIKLSSNTKLSFSVKMFSKKLYGKLANSSKGCYGNWEINLSFEDEMQGKLKHEMTEGAFFGAEPFFVAIQLDKQVLYCCQINKEDYIF